MPAASGVTAVLVSHDGARWLPEVLAALAAQTRPPDRVVCADTGSADDSARRLRSAVGAVVPLPRSTGYGAAVAAALATAPATGWVWLLHDDAAPDPGALEALLAHAADSPSAALLGPKVVDWADPGVLVEVGLTTDAAGSRVSGLERREPDQGQHDAPRDVLSVGTAGALVRRDVWDALGGLDPALPLLRDDLDLGWRVNAAGHRVVVVPAARVRHARAASTGRRALDAAPGRLAAVDRRHALLVLLAHAAGWRLAVALPRLAAGCLLRALLALLARRPRSALDELAALAAVLGRPGRLRAARRARAATRALPPSAVRPLLARRSAVLRTRLAALADRASPAAGRGAAGRRLQQPGTGPAVVLALAAVALLAERALVGAGALSGGRLVPAPSEAGELWAGYAAPGGQPRLALLGAAATALLGRPGVAVDLLLLACVPVSGAVAWAAAGHVVRGALLRGWAAATWALLPVATGAVAAGRLDAAVVQLSLPALLVAGWAVLSRDPRQGGWPRAWALGLGLSAVTAFAPALWPVAAVLLPGAALLVVLGVRRTGRPAAARRAVAALLAVVVPLAVLLPWTWLSAAELLHNPGRLGPGLAEEALPAWHLLLLSPGGPGAPLLVAGGVLLGALGGLLRTGRPRLAAGGWALALVGLAYALVLARTSAGGQPVWPGTGLQVAAAGLLVAVLAGADGLGERLARSTFGRRQVLSVLVVAVTAAVPVLAAAAWVGRGAQGPLVRAEPSVLPAFVRADLQQRGLRVLALAARADGSVGYALTGARGPRLGAEGARGSRLDGAVADLLTPRGADVGGALARDRVGWVVAADPALAAVLDRQEGLARQPSGGRLLWRVTAGPPGAAEAARADRRRVAGQALLVLVVAVLAAPARARSEEPGG